MNTPRSNVGFIIIASERNSAGEEIVLGYNPEAQLYVTWPVTTTTTDITALISSRLSKISRGGQADDPDAGTEAEACC